MSARDLDAPGWLTARSEVAERDAFDVFSIFARQDCKCVAWLQGVDAALDGGEGLLTALAVVGVVPVSAFLTG